MIAFHRAVEFKLTRMLDPLFYDVYTHVAELHLADVGLDVQWSDVEISSEDDSSPRGERRWKKCDLRAI